VPTVATGKRQSATLSLPALRLRAESPIAPDTAWIESYGARITCIDNLSLDVVRANGKDRFAAGVSARMG
jgi:hypothetical protein